MAIEKRPNPAIRALRVEQFQMSRTEFAAHINREGIRMGEGVDCTGRLIAAWEDGDVSCPRPVYRRILTRMTGRSMEDLGFTVLTKPLTPDRLAADLDLGEAVQRRDFISGLAALGIDSELGTPRRIGAAEVRTVQRAVTQLKSLDDRMGGDNLRHDASRALGALNRLINTARYSEGIGHRLRSAYGDLAVLTGWLSYDALDLGGAWSFYNQSLYQSRIAGDAQVEVHAYAQMSLTASRNGMPRDAIELARMGQHISANHVPPRLMSLLLLREAFGWGRLRDATTCHQVLARARRAFDHGTSDDDPRWIRFFSEAEFTGLTATCCGYLGEYDKSAALTEQALRLIDPEYGRNAAWYTVGLAEAELRRGELTDACTVATGVLPLVSEVSSTRTHDRLRGFRREVQQHQDVPAVRDFVEQSQLVIASP